MQAHSQPWIDTHIHLVGTGCNHSGIWLSPELRRRHTIKLLQFFHGLRSEDLENNFDDNWAEKISKTITESPVDFGVVLGFDGVVDPQTKSHDTRKSQLIIPPAWVFGLCEKFPNLLPGPSINPTHKDAMELLDYCIDKKAVLIKWIPSVQLIDPSSSLLHDFYLRLVKSEIPILIHCGGEKTFKSLDPFLNSVTHLEVPLKLGVKVICAHSATTIHGHGEKNERPLLLELLKKYSNLYLDNSGLCNPSRFAHLPELVKIPQMVERTLYGSDYPVPSNAFYYLPQMGIKKVWGLEREKNWLRRDILIKKHFGYPEETMTLANRVLGNLEYWIQKNGFNGLRC